MLPQVGGRRQPQPAAHAGRDLGRDVAELVLAHHDIEAPGIGDEQHAAGVDVEVPGLDVGVPGRSLVEHGAHEGLAAQHVGLVHQGDAAGLARGLAAPGQGEGHVEQPLAAAAGDHHAVGGAVRVVAGGVVAAGEQALGLLAHDQHVHGALGEHGGHAGPQPDGAQPGEQAEVLAYADLRRNLGAVRGAYAGPARRAEQGCVRRGDGVQGVGGQRVPGVPEVERAGRVRRRAQRHAGPVGGLVQDGRGGVHHLRPDAVAWDDGDLVVRLGHRGSVAACWSGGQSGGTPIAASAAWVWRTIGLKPRDAASCSVRLARARAAGRSW